MNASAKMLGRKIHRDKFTNSVSLTSSQKSLIKPCLFSFDGRAPRLPIYEDTNIIDQK